MADPNELNAINTVVTPVGQMVSRPVDQIEDHLYLGDCEIAEDLAALRRLDIKYILSVWDDSLPHSEDDITYKKIDVDDGYGTDLISYFAEANEFIAGAQNAGHNVLVHCHMGMSRSATIVIAYLMNKYKWTAVEANDRVSSRRAVEPNRAFIRQLQVYEQMKYRIDAKNPLLRRVLIETLFSLITGKYRWIAKGLNLFDKYYRRREEFEQMTEDFYSGPNYNCFDCGFKLFSKCNVIENGVTEEEESDPRSRCLWTYIEPQQWMEELSLEVIEKSDGLLKCRQCKRRVVEHQKLFIPYVCHCLRHKDIGKSLVFRIAYDEFKVEESPELGLN